MNNCLTTEEQIGNLKHEDLCEITQSTLRRLIAADPLLSDLPGDVTTEEVLAQIAVLQGQSITIYVLRNLEPPLAVVIPQQRTTVRDLKKRIERSFDLKQQRLKSKTKISWKYLWKTYNLQHGLEGKFSSYPWLEQISRQELLTKGCLNLEVTSLNFNLNQLDHILVDRNHKFLYCYVPKVACTNWKRVLMVLTNRSNATDLTEIPANIAHANSSLTRLSELSPEEAQKALDTFISFLMVREPFERLLSAYRNKLEDNLPSAKYFQMRIGRHIVKKYRRNPSESELNTGGNVSFREFVKYLIAEGFSDANEHWKPIYQLCHPCIVNYTFIGKYEKFEEDSNVVLGMINASVSFPHSKPSRTSDKLRWYLRQLSLDDIEKLYRIYENDFKLFGYSLENVLGFDLG